MRRISRHARAGPVIEGCPACHSVGYQGIRKLNGYRIEWSNRLLYSLPPKQGWPQATQIVRIGEETSHVLGPVVFIRAGPRTMVAMGRRPHSPTPGTHPSPYQAQGTARAARPDAPFAVFFTQGRSQPCATARPRLALTPAVGKASSSAVATSRTTALGTFADGPISVRVPSSQQ